MNSDEDRALFLAYMRAKRDKNKEQETALKKQLQEKYPNLSFTHPRDANGKSATSPVADLGDKK